MAQCLLSSSSIDSSVINSTCIAAASTACFVHCGEGRFSCFAVRICNQNPPAAASGTTCTAVWAGRTTACDRIEARSPARCVLRIKCSADRPGSNFASAELKQANVMQIALVILLVRRILLYRSSPLCVSYDRSASVRMHVK